jgi:anaphase-promoting complex subunit 1
LLRLLLPRTHINAIGEIDKLLVSPQVSGWGMDAVFFQRKVR